LAAAADLETDGAFLAAIGMDLASRSSVKKRLPLLVLW
jgi:hypothetical protein